MGTKRSRASDSSNTDQDSKESKCSRASKGKVYLDKLAVLRSKGCKRDVDFNLHGEPIGKHGAELQSYTGYLARKNIKVSIQQWKDVPDHIKDTIWDAVKLTFNVDDDYKVKCLKSANSKWRQWKSTLYTKHILPYQEDDEMLYIPPPGWGILEEDWKKFVDSRRTDAAREKSNLLKARRAMNIYPHRVSRKGYARLREEMKDQLTEDEEVNRALLWKQARVNKKGEFDGEEKIQTVTKIDDFIEQKENGVFSKSHPTDDILTQALGNPEHSGRVRAVGGSVTPTFYFNLNKYVRLGEGNVVAEMRMEFGKQLADMNAMIIELRQQIMKNKDTEEKGSCSGTIQKSSNHDVLEQEVPCKEAAPTVKANKKQATSKPKKLPKLNAKDIPLTLKMLHGYGRLALLDGRSIKMPIDGSVFGLDHNTNMYIFFEDIHNMCELQPISGTCISVYMWYLYKKCEDGNLLEKIRFVNPYDISHNPKIDSAEKARILGCRMYGTLPNQFVLVPCNVGYHWILLVIDPHKETTYALDPLKNHTHFKEVKIITETAIKMFNNNIGKRGRKSQVWEVIKCQQQPDGAQCGYYVMRYMRDIVENCGSKCTKSISSLFSEGSYSKEEIDDVRREWAEFVYDFVDKNDDGNESELDG